MTQREDRIVFAVRKTFWDSSGDTLLSVPEIVPYRSAAVAASDIEGLEIVEGDVWIFDVAGIPLQAVFSETPSVDPVRNTYIPSVYELQPDVGLGMHAVLEDILSTNGALSAPIHVLVPVADELARRNGWQTMAFLRHDVEIALSNAIPAFVARIVFYFEGGTRA